MSQETEKFHLQFGWPEASDPGADAMDLNTLILDEQLQLAFGLDRSTSTGLTEGNTGGYVYDANGQPVRKAACTYQLLPNSTNYVERTVTGIISVNPVGFTSGRIPLRVVLTNTTNVVNSEDVRVPNLSHEYETTVTKFNGRSGDVLPESGDYTASQVAVTQIPGTSSLATNVQVVLDELVHKIDTHAGAVSSVFGRTGDILAATGDYKANQVGLSQIAYLGDGVTTVQGAIDSLSHKCETDTVFTFNGRHGDVLPLLGDYRASLIACDPPVGYSSTDLQSLIAEMKTVLSSVHAGVSSFNGRQGDVKIQYGDYNASQVTMATQIVAGKDNVQNTLESILEYLRNSGIPVITSHTDTFYSLVSGSIDIAIPAVAVGGTGALTFSIDTGTTSDLNVTYNATTKVFHTNCSTYGPKVLNIKVVDSSTPTAKTATKSLAFTTTTLNISNPSSSNIVVASDTADVNFALTSTGGTAPYRFELVSGDIPSGVVVNNILHSSGVTNRAYTVVVKCIDAAGVFVSKTLTLNTQIQGSISIVANANASITDSSTTFTDQYVWFLVETFTMDGLNAGDVPTYSVVQTSGPAFTPAYAKIITRDNSLCLCMASTDSSGNNIFSSLGSIYGLQIRATLNGFTATRDVNVTDSRSHLPFSYGGGYGTVSIQGNVCVSRNALPTTYRKLSITMSASYGVMPYTWTLPSCLSNVVGSPSATGTGYTYSLTASLDKTNASFIDNGFTVICKEGDAGQTPHGFNVRFGLTNIYIEDICPVVSSGYSGHGVVSSAHSTLCFSNTTRKVTFPNASGFAGMVYTANGATIAPPPWNTPNPSITIPSTPFVCAVTIASQTYIDGSVSASITHTPSSSITDIGFWHTGVYGPTGSGIEYPNSVTLSKAKYGGGLMEIGVMLKTDVQTTWAHGCTSFAYSDPSTIQADTIEIVSVNSTSAPAGGATIWIPNTSPYPSIVVNTYDKTLVPNGIYILDVTIRPKGDSNMSRAFTKSLRIDVVA